METSDPRQLPQGVFSLIHIPLNELDSHPLVDGTVDVINRAFMTSWATIPGMVDPNYKRHDSRAGFIDEMHPDVELYVALDLDGRPVATVGYRPWTDEWHHMDAMKDSYLGDGDAASQITISEAAARTNGASAESGKVVVPNKYELVVLTVDPRVKGTGISSNLRRRMEGHLVEAAQVRGAKTLTLMVRTGKENNEGYWTRAGYREVSEKKFAPGFAGSKTGFTILDMEKVVEL